MVWSVLFRRLENHPFTEMCGHVVDGLLHASHFPSAVHPRPTNEEAEKKMRSQQGNGAVAQEIAPSESASDSETDEESHPLILKPPRYHSPADVAPEGVAAALSKHGAATLTTPLLSSREAAVASRGCAILRDSAQLTYMFANPDSAAASPGACEALHVDLSLIHI